MVSNNSHFPKSSFCKNRRYVSFIIQIEIEIKKSYFRIDM